MNSNVKCHFRGLSTCLHDVKDFSKSCTCNEIFENLFCIDFTVGAILCYQSSPFCHHKSSNLNTSALVPVEDFVML